MTRRHEPEKKSMSSCELSLCQAANKSWNPALYFVYNLRQWPQHSVGTVVRMLCQMQPTTGRCRLRVDNRPCIAATAKAYAWKNERMLLCNSSSVGINYLADLLTDRHSSAFVGVLVADSIYIIKILIPTP